MYVQPSDDIITPRRQSSKSVEISYIYGHSIIFCNLTFHQAFIPVNDALKLDIEHIIFR